MQEFYAKNPHLLPNHHDPMRSRTIWIIVALVLAFFTAVIGALYFNIYHSPETSDRAIEKILNDTIPVNQSQNLATKSEGDSL